MRKQLHAEAYALDRILYLLEEGSVLHLTRTDESFAVYVLGLHGEIQAKSKSLRQASA